MDQPWCLSVRVQPEAGEAVVEWLRELTGTDPVLTQDRLTGLTTVAAYLPDGGWWAAGTRRAVKDGLARIAACGLDVQPARVSWRQVPPRDWSESWKRHFKPLLVGSRLLVRPSWSRRRPRAGQVELVLDPGLSFGTGQHPTTSFCLECVVRHAPADGAEGGMLDVGTGSGILALAAARVGFQRVDAFDFDREAVAVARENAAANGLSRALTLKVGDVAALRAPARPYDLVCANLTADLLQRHARRLKAQVKPGGHLVLAGILAEEFDAVSRLFTGLGLRRVADLAKDEWRSGCFGRPAKRRS